MLLLQCYIHHTARYQMHVKVTILHLACLGRWLHGECSSYYLHMYILCCTLSVLMYKPLHSTYTLWTCCVLYILLYIPLYIVLEGLILYSCNTCIIVLFYACSSWICYDTPLYDEMMGILLFCLWYASTIIPCYTHTHYKLYELCTYLSPYRLYVSVCFTVSAAWYVCSGIHLLRDMFAVIHYFLLFLTSSLLEFSSLCVQSLLYVCLTQRRKLSSQIIEVWCTCTTACWILTSVRILSWWW